MLMLFLQPNPIFFLTVRKGIPFVFCVLFDEHRFQKLQKENSRIGEVLEDTKHISKEVENLLKDVLQNFGIGAKTTLGYK